MHKLWNTFPKIEIHYVTPLVIFIALISGRFKGLFLQCLITLIHELGHVIMALFVRARVKKITWLPFGFMAEIPLLSQLPILHELLIVIAGPLMFFTNWGLLILLYQNSHLSVHMFNQAIHFNETLLLFNLLPLIPLDGSKLIEILCSFFWPVKKVFQITQSLSLITYIALIALTQFGDAWLLMSFLGLSQIQKWLYRASEYQQFLIHRLDHNIYKKIKFHQHHDIYRPYRNWIYKSHRWMSEKEIVPQLIASKSIFPLVIPRIIFDRKR